MWAIHRTLRRTLSGPPAAQRALATSVASVEAAGLTNSGQPSRVTRCSSMARSLWRRAAVGPRSLIPQLEEPRRTADTPDQEHIRRAARAAAMGASPAPGAVVREEEATVEQSSALYRPIVQGRTRAVAIVPARTIPAGSTLRRQVRLVITVVATPAMTRAGASRPIPARMRPAPGPRASGTGSSSSARVCPSMELGR